MSQCAGITKSGARCERLTPKKYCWRHAGKNAGRVVARRAKRGKAYIGVGRESTTRTTPTKNGDAAVMLAEGLEAFIVRIVRRELRRVIDLGD